jgi:hypothetical protein
MTDPMTPQQRLVVAIAVWGRSSPSSTARS